MRAIALLGLLLATMSLGGCAGANASFSCRSGIAWRNDGDSELYTRPPTRNAGGYLHC